MREPYKLLDLFSGIGGFSLGLERTGGFKTVAFCEIDPFCRKVLHKHWPEVPQYDDVRTLTAERLAADGITVDAICGGFPCQDISTAGEGAGLAGERSGLWWEYARLVREIRPKVVIVENVSALLHRGMGEILGTFSALGYDAQWDTLPAWAVGLPHSRERVWTVAYPNGVRELQPRWGISDKWRWAGNSREAIDWILSSGGILRSNDGVPARLDRVGPCGNAVVPQIPELIGRAILAADAAA